MAGDAAVTIAKLVVGTRVTVPARVRQDQRLVATVDLVFAEKTCNYFRALSADHWEAGTSTREAVRRAGLTERSAFRMRSELKVEDDS